MKREWVKHPSIHPLCIGYRLGRIVVGFVYPVTTENSAEEPKWRVAIDLPTMGFIRDPYTNKEDAQARLERDVDRWLSLIGIDQ